MNKKFWERTTTDLGLWKGMNGWLETVIPYDEIAKPVNKSQAHLAAFTRNPKYQGNFVPETVSRNLIAKEDSQLSEEVGIQQAPNAPSEPTTRYGLIRADDAATGRRSQPIRFHRDTPHWGNTGTVRYGLNFWPVVQNSHYTNMNRTYYNGFLAESMAYYTAYYQHWEGGIRNAATYTGWKGRNQTKKVVNTLDWKMNKKGEIYPGNKMTTISAVGVDIESLAQYGDFTTWPQIMWGSLPNTLEREIVTEYAPWMDILGIRSQEDFNDPILNSTKEFSMYQVNDSAAAIQIEGTKALRLQQYCLPDHTSWVWRKMSEYLGANYSLQSFVDAICMIVQTSISYAKLRPEFKSEFETLTLNWLNQYCPIENQEWDKNKLLAVNDLWRLISQGNSGQRMDMEKGSLGADVPVALNSRRGTNNPNQLRDEDFSFNIAPPEEITTQLREQTPEDDVRTAQNLFNWSWMALYSPGLQVTLDSDNSGSNGILNRNPLKDIFSGPIRKMFPINQDGTLKDWQTPQGPISELNIGQWQQVCEMTELGPYPVRTKLIVYDRPNSTWAIQCDSQFINHHWYSEGTSNTPEYDWNIPRELVILDAEMPILNNVPYHDPARITNLGKGGNAQMGRNRVQGGINLLCPNGAVDSQWWASFTSVEEGFCKYFPNYGWSSPKILKMAWDQMARWERDVERPTPNESSSTTEAIPFERPFWATDLTYLEAWQKIYLGQQLAIMSGQNLNQQLSGFLSSGIWNRDFIMGYDQVTGILGQQNDLESLIAEEPNDERRQNLIILAGVDTPEQFTAAVNQATSNSYYQLDASQVIPLEQRQNDMTNFGSWISRIGYQQRRGLQNLLGDIQKLGWVFGSESEVNQHRQEWNEEWQEVVESYDFQSLTVEQFAWPDNWNFAVNRNFAEASAGTKFIINWTRILSYRIKTMLED